MVLAKNYKTASNLSKLCGA